MADAVAITRGVNNKIIKSQFNKIIKNIASPKLSAVYKRPLINWLAGQPTVVNPSTVYTAIVAAEANIAIY